MKKLLLSLSLIVGTSAILSAQTNLIENGGFEDIPTLHQPLSGGTAISWTNKNPAAPFVGPDWIYLSGGKQWKLKQSDTGYIRTDYYPAEETSAGTQSLKLVANKGYSQALPWYNNTVYQNVSIDKTKKYEVKLWAKGNGKLSVQFYTHVTGNTWQAIGGQPNKTFNGTEEWSEYTFTLDVASIDNSKITDESAYTDKTVFAIALQTSIEELATEAKFIWVDNVQVYEVGDEVGVTDEKEVLKTPAYVNNGTVYFNIEETCKVTLYDIVGKAVVTKTIEPGQSLPVQAQGCFILKLENAKGAIQTQKVVIK